MQKKDIKPMIKHYIKQIDEMRTIQKMVYEYKEELLKDAIDKKISENDFYAITSSLSPQSRSPLWEKYFKEKIKATKNKSSNGIGDFKKNGKDYEYKISGFNVKGDLNIVQIRLWQNCDYVITFIHPTKGVIDFLLTHEQMEEEVKQIGTAAHGTKDSNKQNKNIEYRFTIKHNSPRLQEWISKYKINAEKEFK